MSITDPIVKSEAAMLFSMSKMYVLACVHMLYICQAGKCYN